MKYLFYIFTFIALQLNAQNSGISETGRIDDLIKESKRMLNEDLDSSYQLANEAFVLSNKAGYEKGMGDAFVKLASVMNSRGQTDSACLYFRQALHIRKKIKAYGPAANACTNLYYIFKENGLKDSAFFYLYEALRLNNMTQDSVAIGETMSEFGNLFSEYGDHKNAYIYLQKALNIFNAIKDTENLIVVYSGLGSYYYRIHNFDEAIEWYKKSAFLSSYIQNNIASANTQNNIATCYIELRDFDKAKIYFTNALTTFIKLGQQREIASGYYNLGTIWLNKTKPDSALHCYKISLQLFTEMDNKQFVALSLKHISEAYAMKGNFMQAYQSYVEYDILSDSLLNEEKVSSIAEMQTIYETEKKEQQIIVLDEQNKTKSAQRNFFIAGSIVLLLGLFVLGFYYVQKNRLSKKNEQIANQKIESLLNEQEIKTYNAMIEGQEEERKRIATDLHDRLGSMLSTVKLLFGALNTKIDHAQEENKKQYDGINSLLDEAVAEVRTISHNLSTGMVMSFGLVAALQELCDSISKSGLINCKLLVYGMTERLEQQTEIEIYRMMQELFSNILKHAKAQNITIQLNQTEGSLNITVEDDGVGFDVAEKKRNGGIGLKNLEARATKLNGVYHVDSRLGAGTISIIEIPVTKLGV